jgi:hypothetical protein
MKYLLTTTLYHNDEDEEPTVSPSSLEDVMEAISACLNDADLCENYSSFVFAVVPVKEKED